MHRLLPVIILIVLIVVAALSIRHSSDFFTIFPKQASYADTSTPSPAQWGIQMGQPIDDQGNILVTPSVVDRLVASGAKTVRVNFRLGPYPSDTTAFYNSYDQIVNLLTSKGLQVVGLMSNESWPGSQADWTANNWEHTGKDGYNTYIDQYGYALARMAKHWEGKITYWEIWNEPNAYSTIPSPGVYQGSTFIYPSNFAAMLTHTYSQVHYYNHINVKIISGGLFGHNLGGYNSTSSGANYLDDTFNAGINKTGKFSWSKSVMGSYPLDAVGQHIYIDQTGGVNAAELGTYLDYIHNVLTKYEGASAPQPSWVTEFGWNTKSVSEETQADNMSSAFNVFKSKNYLADAIWFQLDDNPSSNLRFGIYNTDLIKKPAFFVFSSANSQNSIVGKTASSTLISSILNYYNSNGDLPANGTPYDNGGSKWAHQWNFGYVQDFEGGTIGRCIIFDTGHRIQHGFFTTYTSGNNHDLLRFPVSDEYGYLLGTRQDFQGGYMTWTPIIGVGVYTY